jgi:hypothetical protein
MRSRVDFVKKDIPAEVERPKKSPKQTFFDNLEN